MPSKFARQALAETPIELRKNVIKYGNDMISMENLQRIALRKLAADKKELLEALKDLLYIDKIMYEREHRKIIARVNEVIKKHETI